MPLKTELTASRSETSQLTTSTVCAPSACSSATSSDAPGVVEPATRRQQQMTHPVAGHQMPRDLAAKLADAARDQHRPAGVETPRQLHHLLADMTALRHLPQRRRHVPHVVGNVRQGLQHALLEQSHELLQQRLIRSGAFCVSSLSTNAW